MFAEVLEECDYGSVVAAIDGIVESYEEILHGSFLLIGPMYLCSEK